MRCGKGVVGMGMGALMKGSGRGVREVAEEVLDGEGGELLRAVEE